MKLRYKLLGGWLAFELAGLAIGLPALATFTERVSFTVPQKVMTQSLPSAPGLQRFLVASNSAFTVISQGAMSEMTVTITQTGNANGQSFGASAQIPGAAFACNIPMSAAPARIYTAQSKTAKKRGTAFAQAVLIEITYDADTSPKIEFQTMDDYAKAPALLALPCDWPLS